MIVAIVDLGSNTIRLSLYRCGEGEPPKLLLGKKTMAGLAGFRENGALTRQGMERAAEVLLEYREAVENLAVDRLAVFATASLRNITNTEEAVEEIERQSGLSLEVISGTEEARLDFVGATHVVSEPEGLLIDIGGGSTELVACGDGAIGSAVSLPIGSLGLYSRYVAGILPKEKERREIKRCIREELGRLDEFEGFRAEAAVGVGGTIRATAKLCRECLGAETGEGPAQLTAGMVRELLDRLSGKREDAQRAILQSVPDRVHTLLPGLLILHAAIKRYRCERVVVSPYGVREGYLFERILKEEKQLE